MKTDQERNLEALNAYCDVLLMLRNLRDKENLARPKKALNTTNAVINRMISHAIRNATDSAHPFGYSDSGKNAAQWISHAAQAQLDNGNAKDLIAEHVIPISVLTDYIVERWDTWDRDDLVKCFQMYSVRAIVTAGEDSALGDAKLRHRMPDACAIEDTFSRYKKAGIPLPLIERTAAQQQIQKKVLRTGNSPG